MFEAGIVGGIIAAISLAITFIIFKIFKLKLNMEEFGKNNLFLAIMAGIMLLCYIALIALK